MADGSFDNVNVATPTGGVLRFQGSGSGANGEYAIYRTTGQQLHIQGGSAGIVLRNNANSATLVTVTDAGNVGISTAPSVPLDILGTGSTSAVRLKSANGVPLLLDAHPSTPNTALIQFRDQNGAVKWQIGEGITGSPDDFGLYDATGSGAAGIRFIVKASSGSVGIGTITPGAGGNPSKLVVVAPTTVSSHIGQADFIDNSLPLAANRGGLINFGGVYDSNGTITTWAGIQGAKANANSSDAQGQLRFFTRPFNAANTERMRIDELGHVGIGTTAATWPLDTQGTIRARDSAGGDHGVELLSGGGVANVIGYERTSGNSGYRTLRVDGLPLSLNAVSHSNVGIDTASPQAKLHVGNSGSLVVEGNIGIGTTSPQWKLDAVGTVRARDGAGADQGVELIYGGGAGNVFAYNRGAGSGYMPLRVDGTYLLLNTMPGTGNVGIGRQPAAGAGGLEVQSGIRSYGSIVADHASISTDGGGDIVSSGLFIAGSTHIASSAGCLYA